MRAWYHTRCQLVLLATAACWAACGANLAHAATCGSDTWQPKLASAFAAAWGIDQRNTRFQPRSEITSANVARLRLSWVYGLATITPRSYPLVTDDTIYVGDAGRGLVALERRTGCERWVRPHEGQISSAILPARIGEREVLLFNDRLEGVYLVDAADGALIWHAQVRREVAPVPWYSGTPLIVGDTVFVPVASLEVGLAVNPLYGCCTTRGGMAAFDLATGEERWYVATIEQAPEVTGRHFGFVTEYGPSGAPVWSSPTYDAERGLLYFGTGQNYSHPTTDTSDAIFAVDAATGEVRWVRQYTANDAYTAACNVSLNHPNCADPVGPDVDFGSPSMLVNVTPGQQLLVVGQKSGDAHALEAGTGRPVWTRKLGAGGIIGGVHWGLAAHEALGLVFVPISDKTLGVLPHRGDPTPGLYGLDVRTGEVRWSYTRPPRCETQQCEFGFSSGIIVGQDLVFAGTLDGYLEAFLAQTGERVWQHDAFRDYEAVNGVPTSGGAFDAHGPLLAGDQLLVMSGYGYVGDQRPGNALLVFELEAGDG